MGRLTAACVRSVRHRGGRARRPRAGHSDGRALEGGERCALGGEGAGGPSAGGSAIASRSCPVAPPRSSRRAAVAGVSAGCRGRGGARAVKALGARSDQAEHAKADDEQEGRDQADRPSDRPELGAKAGDVGLYGGPEPALDLGKVALCVGPEPGDVGLRLCA